MNQSKLKSGRVRPKTILALALILLWLPVQAAAEEWPSARLAEGLAARYGRVEALISAYRRVSTTPATEQIFKSSSQQVATGVLYWARPDRLRLDQASPLPETLVTDGATVWWHLPAENLVHLYRDINVAGQLKPLLSFLGGLEALSRDFDLAPAGGDPARPGQHGLKLTPKDGELTVDHLTVWCDETFALTGFSLKAATGETTDFFLTSFAEGQALDANMFNFKIPRGAEVLEEEN